MDLINQKLGKYEIIESLGQGGMAEVFKAHQPGLERAVAIKVMHRHLAKSPDFVNRFKREARGIGQLQHPHIMQVIDFDVAGDIYYLVMEYIRGQTLSAYLAERGALPETEALTLAAQLASAVDYAHRRGMIHRDIKPANIMFRDDSYSQVILTDFGMARLLDEAGLTVTGSIIGTPAYMSPEAAQSQDVDERADVYSLGVVLHEMITGVTPYSGQTPVSIIMKLATEPLPPPRQFKPDLPEPVEQLLLKALVKDPNERFPSAADLGQAIQQTLATLNGGDSAALPLPPVAPAASPAVPSGEDGSEAVADKPRLGVLLTAGIALVLLIGGGLWFAFAGQRGTQPPTTVSQERAAEPQRRADVAATTAPQTAAEAPQVGVEDTATTSPADSEPAQVQNPPLGALRFTTNADGQVADFSLKLDGVDPPPAGSHYELWLTDDRGQAQLNLISRLRVDNGRIEANGSTTQNLPTTYSRVVISLEDDDDSDEQMSEVVVFSGAWSEPYRSALRALFFQEPVAGKGLLAGAAEQLAIARQHIGFSLAALAEGDLMQGRRHAEHVINTLEGKEGPHFGDLDGDGLAQNPGDGFGVQPYLIEAVAAISDMAAQLDETSAARPFAEQALQTGEHNLATLELAIEQGLKIFASDTPEEAQGFALETQDLLTQVAEGADRDGNGAIDPTDNEGGVESLYEPGLHLAEIPIFPE